MSNSKPFIFLIPKEHIYFLFACIGIVMFYILAKPNGVDWGYYSIVNPKYELFYFKREIISWFIIDIFNNYDQSGVLIASFISSLLMITTYRISFQLSNDKIVASLTTLFLLFSNFYLLLSVNGLRQGISLVFFLISFNGFLAKKNYHFMIWMAAAVLSHNSIILFSPIFLIRHIPHSLFLAGCISLTFISQAIGAIAGKNNNVSPTQNKEVFLILSFILIFISLVHFFSKKLKQNYLITSAQFQLIFFYIFVSLNVFYYSSAIYERLIYTSVPLMIIMSSGFLNSYRPRWLFLSIYSLLIVISSLYSLTHPSVVNNFINLFTL